MRSTLSGRSTPPRLTKPLTSPRRRGVLPRPRGKRVRAPFLLFVLTDRTSPFHPCSSAFSRSSSEAQLLSKLSFASAALRDLRVVYRRAPPRSVREGGATRPALVYSPLPPQPSPASGRASASVSLFLIFSPFPLSFLFFSFFPLPPLPPFPLGGASPGQGQSRPHPAPLPGPRRPMARGRPLLTRAPAAAVGGAGPAAAASGPGSSWN